MSRTISQIALASDRRQLDLVFRLLGFRGAMTHDQAERMISRWQHSSLAVKRRLAGAIISIAVQAAYSDPAWYKATGYAGPLDGAPANGRKLETTAVDDDVSLSCDVVVVGSGAGGGCVAAGLAQAGLDVLVLEMGHNRSASDFSHRERDATADMYLYAMTLATADLGCRVVAGSTVGGGTAVNYSTSFATPDGVLGDWAAVSGVDAFVSGEFSDSLAAVGKRLGVNADSSTPGRRDEIMSAGLTALGWHSSSMPRNVVDCPQDAECGFCGFGCRRDAKQSSTLTYLHDAASNGARIFSEVHAERVLIKSGNAIGVTGRCGQHRIDVRAKAVVVACGAIESPALLLRSGVRGRVGHNLHLHPGTAAWGIFDEPVRMWEGTLQARISEEFRSVDSGYGPIFETVPVHPGAGSTAMPWVSSGQHRDLMSKFENISLVAVLPRDTSSGQVKIGRDGRPKISYRLGADDERRLGDGVVSAAKILEAAGAKEIFSSHPQWIACRPGGLEHWADETRAAGYAGGKVTLFSFHQMGTCAMGVNPSTSVVDADHQVHGIKGLFVADSSNFPNASGVNPMLTVYALAHRAATKIAARI